MAPADRACVPELIPSPGQHRVTLESSTDGLQAAAVSSKTVQAQRAGGWQMAAALKRPAPYIIMVLRVPTD
jgi:hypothetical protein